MYSARHISRNNSKLHNSLFNAGHMQQNSVFDDNSSAFKNVSGIKSGGQPQRNG